jgi:hypothetical protein
MFTKRRYLSATTIVVGALAAAACSGTDSAALTPSAPSANSSQASASGLTAAQTAALSA